MIQDSIVYLVYFWIHYNDNSPHKWQVTRKMFPFDDVIMIILLYSYGKLPIRQVPLTHWGRETHICVGKLTIIASDNGLSPGRRQAIIWTSAGILFTRPLGTKFNEILIEIHTFSFKKMHLKMSSAKWRLFSLGLNELKSYRRIILFAIKEFPLIWI